MTRNLFFILFLIYMSVSYAQIKTTFKSNWVNDDSLVKNNVLECNVSFVNLKDTFDSVGGLIIEQIKFDDLGNKSFYYSYHFDVVNNVDSVFFEYKANNLIQIKTVNTPQPIGQDQIEFLKIIGTKSITEETYFYYDINNRLIKEEKNYKDNKEVKDRIFYQYNKEKVVKKKKVYNLLPSVNDYEESFVYNSKGLLIQKKIVHNATPEDTLISTYTYNSKGNVLKRDNKTNSFNPNYIEVFSYNKNDNIEELIIERVDGKNNSIKEKQVFYYNDMNQVIRIVDFYNGNLNRIREYKYNDLGLKTEENWINIETGEINSSLKMIYKMKF